MNQVLILLLVLINEISSQFSPCPNIFQFHSDGQRSYGIITIPGPGRGRTVMQAQVAIRGQIYNSGSGGLRLLKSLEASVEDAKRGRDIQYLLNFPLSQQMPIVTRLTLNNRDICTGQEVFNANTWTYQHEFTYPSGFTQLSNIPFRQTDTPVIFEPDWLTRPRVPPTPPTVPPTPITNPPTPRPRPITQTPPIPNIPNPVNRPGGSTTPGMATWVNDLPTAGMCGRRPGEELAATHTIIGGQDVIEGEFPWMVALFHYINRVPTYKCGGTLITSTYVVTAAHCTTNQRRIYLELGKHNIANPNEDGYVPRVSLNIIQHPDYESGAHADVALILIERVEFSSRIKPICLWSLGTNLDNLLRIGTVTGWGRVENDGDLSTTPMKLNVRTVGLDICRNSHAKLKDIATNQTFCAGGNNSGPCHGDSGSGFYIRHSNVWYLRGIISTSLGNDFVCNLGEYAVYVDLAWYLDWMRPYLV